MPLGCASAESVISKQPMYDTVRYCDDEDDSEDSISDTLWRLKHQLNEQEEMLHSLQDQLGQFGNKLNQSNESKYPAAFLIHPVKRTFGQ